MIEKEVFAKEWRILCERFNRESSSDLAARYYESLSERMDTDQFRVACRWAFESCKYFPTPDELVQAVRGTTEENAVAEWDLCWSAMEGRDKPLERMSEAGRKTVRLMGGIHRLRNSPLDSVPFLRKEFLRLYGHAAEIYDREHRSLPSWTDEGRALYRDLTERRLLNPGKEDAA